LFGSTALPRSIQVCANLVILETIHDVGRGLRSSAPPGSANVQELIAGYHLMIVRAHGVKVYGPTLRPYLVRGVPRKAK